MLNMMLGEVAPGGTGSGLYGMLILAMITGVHRRPDGRPHPGVPGQEDRPTEMKLAASYFLVTPLIVLTGTAIAMAMPGQRAGMLNNGPHGLSEVFTRSRLPQTTTGRRSPASRQHRVVQHGTGPCDGVRPVPADRAGAGAGWFAGRKQGTAPTSLGTLPTHRPQFVGMVVGVTLILVALTFLPMLALGPLAEGIH